MPSNYTPNYQLNQWEARDRVLRTDFNEDNAKIDRTLAALAAADRAEVSARTAAVKAARDACPLVTLRSVTLAQNTNQFDLDLTGFDWSAYGEVNLYMRLVAQNFSGTITVLLNNQTGKEYYDERSGGYTEALCTRTIRNNVLSATCKVFRTEKGFYSEWRDDDFWAVSKYYSSRLTSALRSEFKTMNFIGALGAGTRFTLLGVRG